MDEMRERQRAMWEAGDYAELSGYITHVGERVVAAAGVEPGMDVLDVACGTGNAALPAALAGGSVTGLDIAPKLLDAGREKARAAGADVRFVEGDAQELPFPDGSFDRVFSTFGHMFAPDQERTAAEMKRVARPGGAIAICCWTPEGTVGKVFAINGKYLPPPPGATRPPVAWGDQGFVREVFGEVASSFEFEVHSATIEWESAESFLDFFAERFGPLVTAREMLGERFGDLRGELLALWEDLNQSEDGRFVLPQEYLQSVVRL